jgi:hypothetical protein
LGILTLVSQQIFEFAEPRVLFLDQTMAAAVPPDFPADGANPLAILGTERLGGKGKVELFENDLVKVDRVATVEYSLQVVFLEFVFHQVQLLGKIDKIESSVDGKFKRAEAAAADKAQSRGQASLDQDFVIDLADNDLGVRRGKKDRVFLDQVKVEKLKIPGDFEPLLGDFIKMNDHGISRQNSHYYTIWTCVVNSDAAGSNRG